MKILKKIFFGVILCSNLIGFAQSDYTFDPGFRVPDNTTHYYRFAVLPVSTAATGEMLTVKLIGGGFGSNDKLIENMYFANRDVFKGFRIQRSGNLLNNKVRIEAYHETNGSVSVYLVMDNTYLHGKIFASTSGIASSNILQQNPPKLTATPSGTKVFSSTEQDNSVLLNANGNMAIQGKLEAKEIKVNLTPTADFVFEENYELPTLEFIENYLKEHKHLPEIAAASEMEKKGVNVGEFQIQLLQKIEELTLYTIAQEKKINQMEAMNEKLIEVQSRLERLESKKD